MATESLDPFLAALRAAAEPTRLRLLALCAQGDLSVSELTRILGQSQPRVSRHLKLLVEAGLVERQREGSWVFHRLSHSSKLADQLVGLAPNDDAVLRLDRQRLDAIKAERAEAAADYFRRNAAEWDELRALHAAESEVEAALVELLAPSPDDVVLDIGTGTGRIIEVLAPRFRRAEGLDLSREMLAVARANLEKAGLDNATVRQGDMYQLPFEGGTFDLATLYQVLHFADEPVRAVAEAGRVLKPGGRLAVVDFAPHEVESLRDDHEHRRLGFADGEVDEWFASAHLSRTATRRLSGDPLTVTLWIGQKR